MGAAGEGVYLPRQMSSNQ